MRKDILLSFLIAAVFIALCYIVLGIPRFGTCDDSWMAIIAAGLGVVDRPDEHMLWTHFLIGLVLKSLYSWAPSIPWYGLYLLSFQILAISLLVLLFLIKTKNNSVATKVGVIAILLIAVCARPVTYMQYTTTAALLGTAAAVLFFFSLDEPASKDFSRFKIKCWTLSILIAVVAALIRERALYMIGIVTAIALISRFLPTAQWRKLITGGIWVIVVLAITVGISRSNDWYYSRGEWREFYPLNREYIPIMQYNRFLCNRAQKRAYAEVGWSQSDLNIFRRWYICNLEKYSFEKFKTIREKMDLIPQVDFARFSKIVLNDVKGLTFYPMIVVIIALLGLNYRPPLIVMNLLFILGIAGVITWLLIFMKLPPYVLAAILAFTVVALLWNTPGDSIDRVTKFINSRLKAAAALLVLIVLVSPVILEYRTKLSRYDRGKELYKAALTQLNPSPRDLYVEWGSSLPVKLIRPFDDFREYFKNFNVVRIASYGRSPLVLNRLRQWGIDDLMAELDREHVYLVSIPGDYFFRPIADYVAETYHKKVSFTNLFKFEGLDFKICKASYKALGTEPTSALQEAEEESLPETD